MGLFLMLSDIAQYEAVGYLAVLGNLIPLDEETCVCALDIPYYLEQASDIIGHGPCPFWFVWNLHQVPVLLGFSSIWENERIH